MSGPGLIEPEGKGLCQICLAHAETRPYGPNGEEVCFACGMKDEAAAERGFERFVLGRPIAPHRSGFSRPEQNYSYSPTLCSHGLLKSGCVKCRPTPKEQ